VYEIPLSAQDSYENDATLRLLSEHGWTAPIQLATDQYQSWLFVQVPITVARIRAPEFYYCIFIDMRRLGRPTTRRDEGRSILVLGTGVLVLFLIPRTA